MGAWISRFELRLSRRNDMECEPCSEWSHIELPVAMATDAVQPESSPTPDREADAEADCTPAPEPTANKKPEAIASWRDQFPGIVCTCKMARKWCEMY